MHSSGNIKPGKLKIKLRKENTKGRARKNEADKIRASLEQAEKRQRKTK